MSVLSGIALIVIGVVLMIGAYTDYTRREIPNWIPLTIFISGFVTDVVSLSDKFVCLIAMVLVLVFITKVMKQRSGGGDIKLYLSLCFALGWFSFFVILSLTLLLKVSYGFMTKTVKKGARFPLCCYLAPAYAITMLLLCLI